MNGIPPATWAIAASMALHGGIFWAALHVPTPGEVPRAIPVVFQTVAEPRPAKASPKQATGTFLRKTQRSQASTRNRAARLPVAHADPWAAHRAEPATSSIHPEELLASAMPASIEREALAATSDPSCCMTDAPEGAASATADTKVSPYEAYLSKILAMIEGRVEYPLQARRMQWAGRSLLHCTVARDGTIQDVEVEASSGYRLLDAAAKRAIEGAGRFPPLPEAIAGETVVLSIPVTFRLEN